MVSLQHLLSFQKTKTSLPCIPELLGICFSSKPKSPCPGKKVAAGAKTCGRNQREAPRSVCPVAGVQEETQPPPAQAAGGRCRHSCSEGRGRPETGSCGWKAALCQSPAGAEEKEVTQACACIALAHQLQEGQAASIPVHHPAKPAGKTQGKSNPLVLGDSAKVLSLSNTY